MMRGGFSLAPALPFALLALTCASCSAPARCDAQQTAYNAPLLQSEERTGSLRLSEANESQVFNFRAILSDLPELWPSEGAVQGGTLPLEVSLLYESEPLGGDGHTEMPRLAVTFSAHAFDPVATTSKYPGPAAFLVSSPLFEICTFGATQCENRVGVQIQRLDGAPYPPVSVSFRASANARVSENACGVPATGPDPRVTLEIEAP